MTIQVQRAASVTWRWREWYGSFLKCGGFPDEFGNGVRVPKDKPFGSLLREILLPGEGRLAPPFEEIASIGLQCLPMRNRGYC